MATSSEPLLVNGRNETAPDQTIDHTIVIYGGDDGQGADGHRQVVRGGEKAEILAMR